MAFQASSIIPAEAYTTVKRAAVQLRLTLQGFNATLAAEGADYDFLRAIYLTLSRAESQFNALRSTPGLAQFAKDQEADQAYDVASEFTSMLAAITAAKAWMTTNVPTNVTAKPADQWDDGSMIANTFTAGQTAGLRTVLSSVIASIE